MTRFLIALTLSLVALLWAVTPISAQGLKSVLGNGSDSSEATPIEEAIKQAADSGVGLVIIDADGKMVAQTTPEPEPAQITEQERHSQLMEAQAQASQFRNALIERLLQLPDAFNEVAYVLRATSPDGRIMTYFVTFVLSMMLFAVGIVVEREVYAKRIARRFVVPRIREVPQGYTEKMPFLVYRFFMGVIGVLVSMAVAYILGVSIFGSLEDTAMQFTVTLINIGYFCCRVAAGLWRMILSPFLPQYRIPALKDRDARRLHRWMWMLASFDICAILFGIWIGELGLNYDVYALVAALLSALLVLANILLVIVNRKAISYALRNGKPLNECSWVTRMLVRIWAPAVVLYVLFAWFELTYDLVLENPSSIPLIAGAYGIIISIIVVYGVINYLIERGFARASAMRRINEASALEEAQEAEHEHSSGSPEAPADVGGSDAEPVLEEGDTAEALMPPAIVGPHHVLNTFEGLARRVAGILAFVAGAYAFFYIWDNESAEMVESFADQLLDIMVIIFIGYVVYHAFRIWIDTKIAEETPEEEVELGDEGGGSSASRLATLLPLFRNVVLIVVVLTILLIVLMEVGINVGPLFAGAGIVGVAIGFGSQALVRDIFAGAFFLFDDAFRKGEYLDVGGVKGTVEKISVRSFQLRHHLGYLHTIPFGELQVMTNFSRDWVMMKLPLRVTYDTDMEKVRKLVKKLGQDLLEDPEIGEDFIQPLKSQGVIEMQDSAMIIRVKFMTKPGDQWIIRKRVYEEIRALFEREGIKFAHREVTVRLADGKADELTEEQKRKIAAAAHASIEDDDDEPPGSGDDDR